MLSAPAAQKAAAMDALFAGVTANDIKTMLDTLTSEQISMADAKPVLVAISAKGLANF